MSTFLKPISRNLMEISATMFISETSRSKTAVSCQLYVVEFVKRFSEISEIMLHQTLQQECTEPREPARSVGGRYTLSYKSRFQAQKMQAVTQPVTQ